MRSEQGPASGGPEPRARSARSPAFARASAAQSLTSAARIRGSAARFAARAGARYPRRVRSRASAWAVVLAWALLSAAGLAAAPRLAHFAVTDPIRFFPDDAPNRRAAAEAARLFPTAVAASQVALVLESDAPGGIAAERARLARLADALRAGLPAESLLEVLDPGAHPVAAQRLFSRDGRAALVLVSTRAGFASEAAGALVLAVERIAEEQLAGSGLRFSLSGHATLGRDYLRAIEEGAARSALATLALVAATLLVVYRAPLAALVSLLTLGAALAVSAGAVALLAQAGLPVAHASRGLLVAIVYGVGTDYCLLLFARVREERLQRGAGDPLDAALAAARGASAPVLAISAAAVGLACALMGGARFGLFAYSGPALAVGVAVALAAVLSLAPALMRLTGAALVWPSRGPRGRAGRLWPALARAVLARPLLLGGACALALLPLALLGLRAPPSYELELDLPEGSASQAGWAALTRRFDPAAVQTLGFAIEAAPGAGGLRSAAGLDALHALSEWFAVQPGVARVFSATRPSGEAGVLARGSLGQQLAELERGLGRAVDGASALAAGLARAEREVGAGRAELADERARLREEREASLLGAFAPERYVEAERGLAAMGEKLARLEAGLREASEGARALGSGIALGRERLAEVSAAPGAASLLARPLLTPDDLSASPELASALAYYLSPDARAARFELELADPPNAPAAVATSRRLRDGLRVLLPALSLGAAHETGMTPITRDLADLTARDQARLSRWIVAGVFLLLVLLLRGIAGPLAITAFMLLSYAAAQGVLALLVARGVWPGLDWKVPFFLFVLLVAIGADYGVFLLGRAREEARALAFEPALARALVATGPVVSSCGLVLAGTFATLALSRIAFLEQVGIGIGVGVLIDTAIVRPFLLPAAALLFERARRRALAQSGRA